MTTLAASDRAVDNLLLVAAFLASTGARFVVVGGCALRMHGLEHRPPDLDLVPDGSPANLRRVFDALDALGTVGPQWHVDAHAGATRDIVQRTTPVGAVDVLLRTGREQYPTLASRASSMQVGQRAVRVASLDDVLRLRARHGKDPVRA